MVRITTTPSWHSTAKFFNTVFLAAAFTCIGFGSFLAWNEMWHVGIMLFGMSVILVLATIILSGILTESQRDADESDARFARDEDNRRFDNMWTEIDRIRDSVKNTNKDDTTNDFEAVWREMDRLRDEMDSVRLPSRKSK